MISISPAYAEDMRTPGPLLMTLSHIRFEEATESGIIMQLHRFSICHRYTRKQTYTSRTRAEIDISGFRAAAERIISIC